MTHPRQRPKRPDRHTSTVSVIIPVFCNAESLRALHRRISRALDQKCIEFELIFVDDASRDNSLSVLRRLTHEDSRIVVLALGHNVGQHAAILIGLHHARGPWSVIMDADLQDPPEFIPELLAKCQQGYAAVFGGRRGAYESRVRLLTSRLFKLVQHSLTGVPTDAGTFVAIDHTVREALLRMRGPFASIVVMIGCTGLPLASLPAERARRLTGGSTYDWQGRFGSGLRAIFWVLYWKFTRASGRMSNGAYRENAAKASTAVAEFIGHRFVSNGHDEE